MTADPRTDSPESPSVSRPSDGRARQVTTIEILGRRYKIESEHDPETIRELASWVDRRIRRIRKGTEPGDVVGAAVLAALNIADEYFETRRTLERREKEIAERSRGLARRLMQASEPVNEESSSTTDE